MKIETKFNVGQEVYYLICSKLVKDKIHSMKVNIESDGRIETNVFLFDADGKCTLKNENEVFATKDEFLLQLTDECANQEIVDFLNGVTASESDEPFMPLA